MRAFDDVPYEEIARSLGIPLATVKVKIHRTRLKLAEFRDAQVAPGNSIETEERK
jgi:DNA-directed RNA polymerase specialized sigma24 family protein